ncbi:transposase [Solwaraspora sp. WMMD406]|uniref:transposase n=1 Tax=Solwaraspora sp. WMMD406 TaxID=3016095 RepID=UPI0024180AC4|nr:transposase [Solwaraspora sp. WMMD406]MDG4767958.1 transposase [Solwaraspora sp. WMMD406]
MSREEDGAVALVRVYCGLATADRSTRSAPAGPALTAAIVDDAGRLLDLREIGDDPAGYARLGTLLVERSSGPSGAAIAADSDDHLVTSLLTAAGRPLAIADDDAADDYAERFADDESLEEMSAPQALRRAIGLARALQAGALSAVTLPAPRDLVAYKPVLAAHSALANGRLAAAVALREVLRELYPAALRAYPDPADPVALAVLDALPEPGMLSGTSSRNRELSVAADAVAAHLAADGVADAGTIDDAVTALRVAIVESPRRSVVNKALTSATAETVRHAVAAVRSCDAAADALVATLAARVTTPTPLSARRTVRRSADPTSGPPATGLHAVPTVDPEQAPGRQPAGSRRAQPQPVSATGSIMTPQPMTTPPVAPAPVAPPPMAPTPLTPAARRTDIGGDRPVSAPPPPPGMTPMPTPRPQLAPADAGEPFRATLTTAALNDARAQRRPTPITPRPNTRGGTGPAAAPMSGAPMSGAPMSAPPVSGAPVSASPVSGPRVPTAPVSSAPVSSAPISSAPISSAPPTAPSNGRFSATDYTLPVPAPRPGPAGPPGSRSNWPLVAHANDETPAGPVGPSPYGSRDEHRTAVPAGYGSAEQPPGGTGHTGRVKPPWLADDLPPEPPVLRLVEPKLAERVSRDEYGRPAETTLEAPALRLVEPGQPDYARGAGRGRRAAPEPFSAPPVPDEGDGDLLIFAAARSAWFVRQPEEADVDFTTPADTGWRAAEQAAQPSIGAETEAGLPKRVPQANLVPGSPLRDERPLRIVRDAASIAEHTNGYFRGWRRGQEIGGYAVGGRPGREAAGGWDFSRDQSGQGDGREFEYRPASYQS